LDNSPAVKGARLEQQMAAYFRLNGYETDLNVKLEGKSGGIHEIDVLVRKSDGITDFTLAVECKAWAAPIEKDVVSKLSMIIADTGVNKGIIVSLQGWRSGAEKSARQEKIDLWGPDELRQHLGAVALAELNAPQTNRYSVSAIQTVAVGDEELRRALDGQSRGLLGLGREDALWSHIVWVPFHLFELHYSTMVKEFMRRGTTKVTPVWALYSALDDRHFRTESSIPSFQDIRADLVIPQKTKAKSLTAALLTTVKKFHEVTTDAARARYREKLSELGLPDTLVSLVAEQTTTVHAPFLVGLLRRRGNERLVAISAHTGKFDAGVSESLTENMAFVRKALGTESL
jgi:hypothetical protein